MLHGIRRQCSRALQAEPGEQQHMRRNCRPLLSSAGREIASTANQRRIAGLKSASIMISLHLLVTAGSNIYMARPKMARGMSAISPSSSLTINNADGHMACVASYRAPLNRRHLRGKGSIKCLQPSQHVPPKRIISLALKWRNLAASACHVSLVTLCGGNSVNEWKWRPCRQLMAISGTKL